MARARGQPRPTSRALSMALAVCACIVLVSSFGRLRGTENLLLNLRFQVRPPAPTTHNVLIVALEQPLDAHTGFSVWPMNSLAALVRRLHEAGADIIVLDVPALARSFERETPDPGETELAAAIAQHGKVILPMHIDSDGAPRSAVPQAVAAYACGRGELPRPIGLQPGFLALPPVTLIQAAVGIGANNVYPSVDGVVREAPLAISWQDSLFPSLWTEIVRVADGLPPGSLRLGRGRAQLGQRSFPITPAGEVIVNYRGGYRDFPRLSYHALRAMTAAQLRSAVAGKIVLVGVDLPSATRYLRTPTAPEMPGVEVAAYVTDNLLAGDPLSPPAAWVRYLSALLLCLLTAHLLARSGPLAGLLLTLLLLVVVLVLGVGLFLYDIYLPMAEALLAVGLTGAILVVGAAAEVDRRRVEAEARLQSRLQTIAGVNRLAASSLDRDQLLLETLRWVEAEIGAEACSLLLLDEDRRHLRFEVALGEKGPMLKDFQVEVGKGIAGTVAEQGVPIVVDDVRRDPRWAADIAQAIEFRTRSILCVPMILQDRVVGVIELINKRHGTFTDEDTELLQVIAHQAALFLERARLYRELEQRVDYANAELREANRRLALEMSRIATLVDQLADGVIATDGRDRIVICNEVAGDMFGLDARRAVGQPVLAVVRHPDLVSLFAMPLSPHGGSYETEIVLDPDRGRTLMARIALVEQPGEQAVSKCAVFTDITHLKQLDQMKMDLISFVSHELKNPIASLQGACQMLESRLQIEDEQTARLLAIARRQGRRMQYLVQDFLDLSRIEAGLRLELSWNEIRDVPGLIAGVFELCRHGGPAHQRVIEVAPDMPIFWADTPKLESVLINLVENAHKYSPDGGKVTVAAFPRDGEIVFEVRDQGVGIKEADLPRLFRSFARLHDSAHGTVSGTGVGLYICKHIVEAHGGHIEVESVWGKGSTFRVVLPHYTAPPGAAASAPTRLGLAP